MQTLLNLLAGVSLLVWGTHLVRTGILRLYGGDLRRILRRSVSRRPAALKRLNMPPFSNADARALDRLIAGE